MKPVLTIDALIESARRFCEIESRENHVELIGVTDGKAVGTYVEHKFQHFLQSQYRVEVGSSAKGIDLPGVDIQTDIKVTSIKQPQSSCPFKDSKQKIYGLGYNLIVFVYKKADDMKQKKGMLEFVSCTYIDKSRTADYQTTTGLRQIIENKGNADDIFAFLNDHKIPSDEVTLMNMAKDILKNKPAIGYLTISNALQWRLQYGRIVTLNETVDGISPIVKYEANIENE